MKRQSATGPDSVWRDLLATPAGLLIFCAAGASRLLHAELSRTDRPIVAPQLP